MIVVTATTEAKGRQFTSRGRRGVRRTSVISKIILKFNEDWLTQYDLAWKTIRDGMLCFLLDGDGCIWGGCLISSQLKWGRVSQIQNWFHWPWHHKVGCNELINWSPFFYIYRRNTRGAMKTWWTHMQFLSFLLWVAFSLMLII